MKRKILFALVIAVMLASITAIFASAEEAQHNTDVRWGLRPPPLAPSVTLYDTDLGTYYYNNLGIGVDARNTEIGEAFGVNEVLVTLGLHFEKIVTAYQTKYTITGDTVFYLPDGTPVHVAMTWFSQFHGEIVQYPQIELSLGDGTMLGVITIGENGDLTPDRVFLTYATTDTSSYHDNRLAEIATTLQADEPEVYNWLVTFFEFRDRPEMLVRPWLEFYNELSQELTSGFQELWRNWTPLTKSYAVFFGVFTVTLLGAWLTNFIKRR